MNTSALDEVLQAIHGYNLTTEEKQWIAHRLCVETQPYNRPQTYEMEEDKTTDMLREDSPLQPYTMEEINARLEASERDFEEGHVWSSEEMSAIMHNHVYQAQAV